MGRLPFINKEELNVPFILKRYGCSVAMVIACISPLFPLNQPVTLAQVSAKADSPRPAQRKSILESILAVFRRSLKPMGSRGAVCLLSPGVLEQKNIIWSDRPLFLWQGGARELEVRPYALGTSYQDQPILWRSLSGLQAQPYAGEPLKPGQTYQWELKDPIEKKQMVSTFQVMDSTQRQQIATALQTLEQHAQRQGVSKEERIIQRAQYFSDQGLLSDALQELYSLNQPSIELTQTIAQMTCPPSTLNG